MYKNQFWGKRIIHRILLAILVVGFLALSILSLRHMTMTYDEDHFFLYGMQLLQGNAARGNPSVMPVNALNAVPKWIGMHVQEGILGQILNTFQTARLVTIIFSASLGLLCFYWSKALYGYWAGLLTIFLCLFEPNLIAHGRLVTTDLYATFGIALAVFSLWLFTQKQSVATFLFAGLALGFSQCVKFTSVLLYPLLFILLFLSTFPKHCHLLKRREYRATIKHLASILLLFMGLVLISLLVINAGFLFRGTFMSLNEYPFYSSFFNSLQNRLYSIGSLPLPLPRPYLSGLDRVLHHERTARGGDAVFYLLGKLQSDGFTGYYAIASLFKMPIAFQAIIIWAVARYFVSHKFSTFFEQEQFLLIPILFFAVYFNFFNDFHKGIRHYLVIIPFMTVFSGTLLRNAKNVMKRVLLTGVLCLYMLVSVLSYFPDYIGYFNEIVYDRDDRYLYLADSNLDWGQSQWYLDRYLETHPEVEYAPKEPSSGSLIISVNELLGIIGSPKDYAWLRENYQPFESFASSYLLFKIDPDGVAE